MGGGAQKDWGKHNGWERFSDSPSPTGGGSGGGGGGGDAAAGVESVGEGLGGGADGWLAFRNDMRRGWALPRDRLRGGRFDWHSQPLVNRSSPLPTASLLPLLLSFLLL